MPDIQLLNTLTDLTVNGADISIKTYYIGDELPNTIMANIAEMDGIQDTTMYLQGDGIIKMKNNPYQIDYNLDNTGNLILINTTGDEAKYSIDGDGNLIYTF